MTSPCQPKRHLIPKNQVFLYGGGAHYLVLAKKLHAQQSREIHLTGRKLQVETFVLALPAVEKNAANAHLKRPTVAIGVARKVGGDSTRSQNKKRSKKKRSRKKTQTTGRGNTQQRNTQTTNRNPRSAQPRGGRADNSSQDNSNSNVERPSSPPGGQSERAPTE